MMAISELECTGPSKVSPCANLIRSPHDVISSSVNHMYVIARDAPTNTAQRNRKIRAFLIVFMFLSLTDQRDFERGLAVRREQAEEIQARSQARAAHRDMRLPPRE